MGLLPKLPFSITIGRTKKLNENLIDIYTATNKKFDINNADQISTVYTCVKILSETLSRLPVGVYKADPVKGKHKDKEHPLWNLLHYNPNEYTTSQTFFNSLEAVRNLHGNAFALIHRVNGLPHSLELINNDRVKGFGIVNNQLYYDIDIGVDKNEDIKPINSANVLHFRGLTKNGIWGVNPIEALRLNLSTTHQALTTVDNFFQNNAMSAHAIKSTVAGVNQTAMLDAVKSFQKENAGAAQAGKMIPLPPNTELQQLSMSFVDAEFINTAKFNSDQISSLFGVPSYLVGNTEASKYSNIEQTQISFKVNTMSAITRMYRQELEFKLLTTKQRNAGETIEFNLMAMVETDHKTRLEGYRILANIGALSPADVIRLEGGEIYEGAEEHFIQTNLQSVEQYMKKAKGTKTTETIKE